MLGRKQTTKRRKPFDGWDLLAVGTIVSVLAGMILFTSTTPGLAKSQSLGGLTLLQVAPRVITPNGDSLNDATFFKFDNVLSGLPLESAILDIHGAKVSSMDFNSDETALIWNGKDDSGRSLPSGIYIYSIKIGKNLATGTIVVAK